MSPAAVCAANSSLCSAREAVAVPQGVQHVATLHMLGCNGTEGDAGLPIRVVSTSRMICDPSPPVATATLLPWLESPMGYMEIAAPGLVVVDMTVGLK